MAPVIGDVDLLAGVRIASFNHFLMGPLAAQILGDLGGDVVMVEPVDGGYQRHWSADDRWLDGESTLFLCANRNKRSLAIDLKTADGRAIAFELCRRADVVMENFRPGVMDRLGLGYDAVRAVNPQVVYASASGFGSSGPRAAQPGQDLLLQAFSGLAWTTGRDGPTAIGTTAVDHHGSTVFAAAILAALFARERTGRGRRIEVDLLSAALDLQQEGLTTFLAGGDAGTRRPQGRIADWYHAAPYGIYEACDGWLAISIGALDRLAAALDLPELAGLDERSAWEQRGPISEKIQERIATAPRDHWLERLRACEVWHAPVNDYPAIVADPQVAHNRNLQRIRTTAGTPVRLPAHAACYDGTRPGARLPPPPLGAHTRAILQELGYDAVRIEELAARGVIRTGSAASAADHEG